LAGKIKILFVTDGLGNGGKERQLVETLKNINRNKFEIGVITFNSNQFYESIVKNIADYFNVFRKDKNILEPFISVFESFEKFRPDIVHSFDLLSSIYTYLPSRFRKAKIVNASIQDAGLDKGWQFMFKKYLLNASDLIVGNSFKGLSYYHVDGNVLYNFIDTNRFQLNSDKSNFNIAMVANFSDYKDYDAYFTVIKELLKYSIIDKAYAVGDGKYLNKYRNIISNDSLLKERVVFTGNIDNVEEFLSNISIGFLFSTEKYSEGISNSVLEYMAAGVVPIVSDIGASSEIIDNETDGFLVNKIDLNRIVEIVIKLKENQELMFSIKDNAKKKVKDRFSMNRNISKLELLYDALIKG
jgi:glycosyltransferase involved in cell wall biosynthesis